MCQKQYSQFQIDTCTIKQLIKFLNAIIVEAEHNQHSKNIAGSKVMVLQCRSICEMYKAEPVANSLRYEYGQRWCSNCCMFLISKTNRCPCCNAMLRKKQKSKK